jgi:prefoldin subunit 2
LIVRFHPTDLPPVPPRDFKHAPRRLHRYMRLFPLEKPSCLNKKYPQAVSKVWWLHRVQDDADSMSSGSELQTQYQTFKNTLQQLAQKIGDVELEAEEHKWGFWSCIWIQSHRHQFTACYTFDPHRYSLHSPADIFWRLVLETLEPLSADRKCFRMINGVLVERTVKEVVPALKTNSEGLKQVLDELVLQYKSKQDEMEKWKVCDTDTPNWC